MQFMRYMQALLGIGCILVLCACGSEEAAPHMDAAASVSPDPPQPRRENGLIDYVRLYEEHRSKGVTKENNAATLLVPFLGYPLYGGQEQFKQACDKLGIEANEDDRFVHLGEVLFAAWEAGAESPKLSPRAARLAAMLPAGMPAEYRRRFADRDAFAEEMYHHPTTPQIKPWSAKEHPLLEIVLRANETTMANFRQAVNRERLYLPHIQPPDQPFILAVFTPSNGMYREAVDLVLTRAMHRVHQADVEGAWDDVMSCYRLATLVRQEPSMMAMIGAGSIDSRTHETARRLAIAGGWQAERLRRCLDDLMALERGDLMPLAIHGEERFRLLDQIAWFQHAVETGDLPEDARKAILASTDWKHVEKELAQASDQAMKAFQQDRYSDRINALKAIGDIAKARGDSARRQHIARLRELGISAEAEGQKHKGAGLLAQYAHLWNLLPQEERGPMMTRDISLFLAGGQIVGESTFQAHERYRVGMDLTRLAFALAAYRAQAGRYPDQLLDLVPNHLKSIPNDRFTERPLIYKLRPDGFLLYSVGSNLEDDDGAYDTKSKSGLADIAILVKDGKIIDPICCPPSTHSKPRQPPTHPAGEADPAR